MDDGGPLGRPDGGTDGAPPAPDGVESDAGSSLSYDCSYGEGRAGRAHSVSEVTEGPEDPASGGDEWLHPVVGKLSHPPVRWQAEGTGKGHCYLLCNSRHRHRSRSQLKRHTVTE